MDNKAMTPVAQLNEVFELERVLLNVRLRGFLRGFEMCESPIEQRFYVAWLNTFSNLEPGLTDGGVFHLRGWLPGKGLDLYPQATLEVDGQKYRVDFFIATPPMIRLVVELDGHDFHERTKQQATKDKTRDRAFARNRYTVLRFTGSEIFRDPYNAIREIQNTIARLAA